MTFEERCRLSEQCLPNAPYRNKLTALHNEMLAALAQPEQEPFSPESISVTHTAWKMGYEAAKAEQRFRQREPSPIPLITDEEWEALNAQE